MAARLVPGSFPCGGAMRLGSGAFAACCVVIEVLGVALFLRGFFPAPVRSSSRAEQRAEPAAPEPSAGTDPSPPALLPDPASAGGRSLGAAAPGFPGSRGPSAGPLPPRSPRPGPATLAPSSRSPPREAPPGLPRSACCPSPGTGPRATASPRHLLAQQVAAGDRILLPLRASF